jgi:rubrerythrin
MNREGIMGAIVNRFNGVAACYAKYHNATTNLGLRKLIESLLEQEREYSKEIAEAAAQTTAEHMFKPEAESTAQLENLLTLVSEGKPGTDLEMLKRIRQLEEQSFTLLDTLHSLSANDDAGFLFGRMKDEERKHISWITDRIDLLELGG